MRANASQNFHTQKQQKGKTILEKSPLYEAMLHGNLSDILQILSDPENDPNQGCLYINDQKTTLNKSPLYFAIKKGFSEIVILSLINHPKIDLNTRNGLLGETPLISAIYRNDLFTILALLQKPDLDVNMPDFDSKTPIEIALLPGNDLILKELMLHPKINLKCVKKNCDILLEIAIKSCCTPLISKVLRNPFIDPNPSLYHAIKKGNVDLAKMLLKHSRAEPNKIVCGAQSLFALARLKGNTEMIKLFLDHPKVDIHAKSESGRTLLERALANEDTELVEILLAHPKMNLLNTDIIETDTKSKSAPSIIRTETKKRVSFAI